MPPSRPGGVLRTPPPRQLTPTAQLAAAQYRVKILVAGVDKDARAAVERSVRQAFTLRDPAESWSVSLVRITPSWSGRIMRGATSLSTNTVRLSYFPSPFVLSHRLMRLMGSCSRLALASIM